MQQITLVIAIIACAMVFMLPSIYALVVYITAMLWYPSYLVVTLGTIDISVGRFVVAALILRAMLDSKIRKRFVWTGLDTLVTLNMAVYVGMFFITLPFMVALESQSGFLMDTWFAYLAARLFVSDHRAMVTLTKSVGLVLVPLAFLGLSESVTGWEAYRRLTIFCPWIGEIKEAYEPRWGFFRATGPFNHPILFGGVFAMFLPFVYYLRKNVWKTMAYVIATALLIGTFSSVSSGAWIMIVVVMLALSLEKKPHLVKPILIAFTTICISIGLVSNRPFYHVLVSLLSGLGGTGWHRAKLIDVAIMHFGDWWLAGYGGKDPGWGHYMGMGHTDVTNQYILAGVKYGVWGLIALCLMMFGFFRSVIRAYAKSSDRVLKSLYWHIGCLLFSVLVIWLTVTFFGQLESIFYFIIGIIGSSVLFQNTYELKVGLPPK